MNKSESRLVSFVATNLGTLGGLGQLQPFTFSTADIERYVFYGEAPTIELLAPQVWPVEVVAPEEIEVAPQLGMNFEEAVRRGRLLAQRLAGAADVDVDA